MDEYKMNEAEMLALLAGEDDEVLFERADRVRGDVFGSDVFIRSIIEFSNICDKGCRYCGLRARNSSVSRYRLFDADILACVDQAVAGGAGTIVLQSGDDIGVSSERIGSLVWRIKSRHDVAVTLSLGDRDLDEYAFWRDCGADRCLLKLETTDMGLYKRMRQGEVFAHRLHRLESLRTMGFEIGSGVISGLPGTNLRSALMDILFLTQLQLDMIAVGPFIPHPDTPLGDETAGDPTLSMRMTALLRILNPGANIPATSALDAAESGGRVIGLRRGCNVLMPSLTPESIREDYFIYPGKNTTVPDGENPLARAENMIRSAGFTPSADKGASRRQHVGQGTQRSTAGHHPGGEAEFGQVVADQRPGGAGDRHCVRYAGDHYGPGGQTL